MSQKPIFRLILPIKVAGWLVMLRLCFCQYRANICKCHLRCPHTKMGAENANCLVYPYQNTEQMLHSLSMPHRFGVLVGCQWGLAEYQQILVQVPTKLRISADSVLYSTHKVAYLTYKVAYSYAQSCVSYIQSSVLQCQQCKSVYISHTCNL